MRILYVFLFVMLASPAWAQNVPNVSRSFIPLSQPQQIILQQQLNPFPPPPQIIQPAPQINYYSREAESSDDTDELIERLAAQKAAQQPQVVVIERVVPQQTQSNKSEPNPFDEFDPK